MKKKIIDSNFGVMKLYKENCYSVVTKWNRDLDIRLFINVEIESSEINFSKAWDLFNDIKKKEPGLFKKAIKKARANEYKDDFFYSDISLEIFENGEGHIVYLLFMVGPLIIEFSNNAVFEDAYVMGG